jgi:cytochrome c biogenesis protein CcmG/thiol:disulfide interchange protein DsbE
VRPRLLLVLLAGILAAGVGCSEGGGAANPGDGVALESSGDLLDVELPTFEDGETFRLADIVGGPVVVNFFASWCAPCVREMPGIESVKQAVGDEVTFVGIDVQDRFEDGLALIERTGITWQTARDPDGELLLAAQVQGMPTTLLLDEAGRVLERRTGAISEDELADLLAEHFGIEVPNS